MTENFYQQLAAKLADENLILATVIQTKGSTPREIAAKMLINQNGEIIGTIGGGAGEAKVIQAAQTIFKNYPQQKHKQILEIDLSGNSNRETQGVCGGSMQVLLEVCRKAEYLTLVEQILKSLTANQAITLVTPIFSMETPYLTTHIQPPYPQLEKNKFLEPIIPNPRLLIIGGGHVAVPLAKIAATTGFEVIIQDDRPEFANLQRFPDASRICADKVDSLIPILANPNDLYIALVTRGYQQDIAALKLILPYQPKYIGMIGSQKRVQMVLKNLQIGDCINAPHKIHAPIGLDIGALTPAEIAVSICAEIIQVRRGGTGLPLSQVAVQHTHSAG